MNLYGYAANSPTNFRDPSGLRAGEDCTDWYLVTYNQKTGDVVAEVHVGRSCPNGGFTPSFRDLSSSERDRLQCVSEEWLSDHAKGIFLPMLNGGRVLVGDIRAMAQTNFDQVIVFTSSTTKAGSVIGDHNEFSLARLIAHEVGHVTQLIRFGRDVYEGLLSVPMSNPTFPFRIMDEAYANRYMVPNSNHHRPNARICPSSRYP